ncbi:MAG: cyclase family protein [Flavobacteriales bacterium]
MRLYLTSDQFIETSEPIDISMSLQASIENVRAWYVDPPRMEVVRANGFVGSIQEGGSVNFRDVFFNPHGHGTHTECCGHITQEVYAVNEVLKEYFYRATLLTIQPIVLENGDMVVKAEQLKEYLNKDYSEAIIIRTLPNKSAKKSKNYSGTNPCYFDVKIVELLNEYGVKHFLVDQPSVDREEDGGALAFHHAFWNVPEKPNFERTITELIYVPTEVEDGNYILEIQMAAFQNDASPSRPVLYKLQ